MVRLIEELHLRLPKLLPIWERLQEIASRMATIKARLGCLEMLHSGEEHDLRRELLYLMKITLETPATLGRLVTRTLSRKASL